jgi:hypothetical protein
MRFPNLRQMAIHPKKVLSRALKKIKEISEHQGLLFGFEPALDSDEAASVMLSLQSKVAENEG